MMSIKMAQVDEATFKQEVMEADLPVLVDLGAPWCYYCRILEPVLEQLAPQYEGRIKFVKLNTDQCPNLSEVYQITTVPTMLFIHHGHLIGRETEAFKPPEVRKVLDDWLAAVPA